MSYDTLLEETLEAWADARHGLIEEVGNIPADRFGFRPTPETRSVAGLIQHILEVALMMTGELTRPDTNFRRAPWPELLEMYAGRVRGATSKEALIELLGGTLDEGLAAFRSVGELAMLQLITRFDGQRGQVDVRLDGDNGSLGREVAGSRPRGE